MFQYCSGFLTCFLPGKGPSLEVGDYRHAENEGDRFGLRRIVPSTCAIVLLPIGGEGRCIVGPHWFDLLQADILGLQVAK